MFRKVPRKTKTITEKTHCDFIAVPIQVDACGPVGRVASAPGDDARGSMFETEQRGRDSMFTAYEPPHNTCNIRKFAVCKFLDSWEYQIFSLLLVFYSLFAYNLSVLFEAPPSANPWLNTFLLLCIAIFLVEAALNATCRNRPNWFLLFLDIIATLTIVVDLSWVADAAHLNDSNGSRTSDAAMISARAGRIIRLVRLLRLLRTVSFFSRLAKRALQTRKTADMQAAIAAGTSSSEKRGKLADPGSPSNIGGKLTDALIVQVALVVIITVISTALLTSWGVEASPFDAYVAALEPQANQTLGELEPQVASLQQFVDEYSKKDTLLTLRIGDYQWDWVDPALGMPKRPSSIAIFNSSTDINHQPAVSLQVDISEQNAHDALLDILIILLVLFILLVFVASVNITIYKTLVRPLERIYWAIMTHSTQLVAALGPGEPTAEDVSGVDEDGDLGTIEAAVQKLLRIVAHSTATGREGTHVARSLAAGADNSTREWLATMVGDGVKEDQGTLSASVAGKKGETNEGDGRTAGNEARNNTTTGDANILMSTVKNLRTSILSNSSQNSVQTQSVAAAAATAAAQFAAAAGGRTSATSTASIGTPESNSRAGTGSFGVLNAGASQPMALASLDAFGSGLSPAQKEALLAVDLEALHSFRFDVLSLQREELTPHIVTMFFQLGLAAFSQAGVGTSGTFVDAALLWRFVDEVFLFYRDVPYHNIHHCVDVTHSTFLLIDRLRASSALTPVECFALMVAALAHDMDHPGVNNAFLVNARDPLALTYNDASVLENRHVACLYALVAARPDVDIFASLDAATWKEVRRLVIAAVLHTDMTQHFPMVSKLEVFLEFKAADIQASHTAQRNVLKGRSGSGASVAGTHYPSATGTLSPFAAAYSGATDLSAVFNTPEERTLLLSIILHCADISNPARSPEIASKWADRVLAEFFLQGDQERDAGQSISPLCDRFTTNRATSQINFIEFVVAPLFSLVSKIFPDAGEIMENTMATRRYWQQLALEGAARGGTMPSEGAAIEDTERLAAEVLRVETRMSSFLDKYKEVVTSASRRKRSIRRRVSSIITSGPIILAEGDGTPANANANSRNVLGSTVCLPSASTLLYGSARTSMASSHTQGSNVGSESVVGSPLSPSIAPENSKTSAQYDVRGSSPLLPRSRSPSAATTAGQHAIPNPKSSSSTGYLDGSRDAELLNASSPSAPPHPPSSNPVAGIPPHSLGPQEIDHPLNDNSSLV